MKLESPAKNFTNISRRTEPARVQSSLAGLKPRALKTPAHFSFQWEKKKFKNILNDPKKSTEKTEFNAVWLMNKSFVSL